MTPEYCAKHNWIIGSPKTVVEKIEKIYDEVGGFGQLLVFGFDYADNPQAWRHSLELLSKEVMPKVQHLKPGRPGWRRNSPPPHQGTELRGPAPDGPTPRSARARPG